jgi:hypothetical protein
MPGGSCLRTGAACGGGAALAEAEPAAEGAVTRECYEPQPEPLPDPEPEPLPDPEPEPPLEQDPPPELEQPPLPPPLPVPLPLPEPLPLPLPKPAAEARSGNTSDAAKANAAIIANARNEFNLMRFPPSVWLTTGAQDRTLRLR